MKEFSVHIQKAISSDWTYRLTRWVIGIVFLYAGATKLMAPQSFAILIDAYGLVPESLLKPLAVGLPLCEIGAGIGLILDKRGSLTAIVGLLVLFLTVLGYGIWMGLDVDCGCFGSGDPEAKAFHGLRTAFYRDLIMITGALYLYWWRLRRPIVPARL
jgi:uncharacterized membrane protein YphA (DoxX/SURF4 family)